MLHNGRAAAIQISVTVILKRQKKNSARKTGYRKKPNESPKKMDRPRTENQKTVLQSTPVVYLRTDYGDARVCLALLRLLTLGV